MLSFFPRDVLDEILNLIESVSEVFPSYSFTKPSDIDKCKLLCIRQYLLQISLSHVFATF